MQKSVLDAIREGTWDYEPDEMCPSRYNATGALPGSAEKLAILAERAQRGLPLWHDRDRRDYEEGADGTLIGPAGSRKRERGVEAPSEAAAGVAP